MELPRSDTPSSFASSSLHTIEDDEQVDVGIQLGTADLECQLPTATLFQLDELLNPDDEGCKGELNPLAKPFVPSRKLELYPRRMTQLMPLWITVFEIGAHSQREDTAAQRRQASALLNQIQWTSSAFAELAKHFTWMACNRARPHDGLARFALEIHRQLQEHAPRLANNFVWQLQQNVLHIFRCFWDTRTSSSAISYQFCASFNYVQSAHLLGQFMGELFYLNLVQLPDIHFCLDILLTELSSHEHLDAILNITNYAQLALWYKAVGSNEFNHDHAEQFLNTFRDRASALKNNSSLLGKSVPDIQRDDKVRTVIALINAAEAAVRIG